MPIRISIIVAGCITLLSACGGGGGGAGEGGSASGSSVYMSEITYLGLDVGDQIPLSSLYALSSPSSSKSWLDFESDLEADIDTNNNGLGKITITDSQLIAQGISSTPLTALGTGAGVRSYKVVVCDGIKVLDVVPSGVGMHLNKDTVTDKRNLSRNKGYEFKYQGGTAIKAGVPTIFVGAGVCADGSGAISAGLTTVNEGSSHYMMDWLSFPVKSIAVNNQTFNNGQAVTVNSAGRYTATATFYNGTTQDFELTVYNSLSAVAATAVASNDAGDALWFTNLRLGSKPLVKFTQVADANFTLDVSANFTYWYDVEHLGINEGFRKLYSWVNGS